MDTPINYLDLYKSYGSPTEITDKEIYVGRYLVELTGDVSDTEFLQDETGEVVGVADVSIPEIIYNLIDLWTIDDDSLYKCLGAAMGYGDPELIAIIYLILSMEEQQRVASLAICHGVLLAFGEEFSHS